MRSFIYIMHCYLHCFSGFTTNGNRDMCMDQITLNDKFSVSSSLLNSIGFVDFKTGNKRMRMTILKFFT